MTLTAASINLSNDCLLVSGEINFATAVTLWNQSLPLLSQCSHYNFDFSKVTTTNSAGLALLIEWLKEAKTKQRKITFQHLPHQLMAVALVAGIGRLIKVAV